MENLTTKEEEMMELFWTKGSMFVNEIRESYENKEMPHSSTITSCTHRLEEKGFLGHLTYGGSFQYYPIISRQSYGHTCLCEAINKYYDSSFPNAILMLLNNGDISVEELKALIKSAE